MPERSTDPLRIEDVTTGMAIDVQVRGVFNVAAQPADGYTVYPHAEASGWTLLHRIMEDGAEYFVSFETRPAVPEITYDLTLAKEVSGLRLVGGALLGADLCGPSGHQVSRATALQGWSRSTVGQVAAGSCTQLRRPPRARRWETR